MQLVGENDDEINEQSIDCLPTLKVPEDQDHQAPDIEMVNIEDSNADQPNSEMNEVNENNSYQISTQSTTSSSASRRQSKVKVQTVSSSQRHCWVCQKESGRHSIPK